MFSITTSDRRLSFDIEDEDDGDDQAGLIVRHPVVRQTRTGGVTAWQEFARITADQLAESLRASGHLAESEN